MLCFVGDWGRQFGNKVPASANQFTKGSLGHRRMKNIIVVLVVAAAGYYAWDKYMNSQSVGGIRSHNDVIVYTSQSCGRPCWKMTKMLDEQNVAFIVELVDEDDKIKDELRRKLDAIGFNQRVYKLPVVDVYGNVFPDNPSMNKVKAALP